MWLAAALAFLICEAVAAAAVPAPGFSYATNLISELGVPEWSPLSEVMNAGLFLQGLLFLAGAVLVTRVAETGRRRLFLVLVSLYALGALLVATFHGNSARLVTMTAVPSIGMERCSPWWAEMRR